MAIGANNLLMLALSNYRRKLFDLQTFQNQAHIISVTGIIIYFLGTYYLYTIHRSDQGHLGPIKILISFSLVILCENELKLFLNE